MLIKKDVLILNGQKFVQSMQVHKKLMLQIMSERITAHHLLCLFVQLAIDKDQWLMLKEFCNEQFVSKGMIADFAIHDKGDGNPHAHILLTIRAMDEHGKWLPKARKVYDLDENGERIQLPSGNWKCHKENTVDWNDQKYAEVWRHS